MLKATRQHLRSALFLFALVGALAGCDITIGEVEKPQGYTGPFAQAAASPGEWSYRQPSGATCQDGSQAGYGVQFAPAPEGEADLGAGLLIYLQGGGACFNSETCARTAKRFGPAKFEAAVANALGERGILNRERPENPTREYTHVYVPYCTGDVHAGSRAGAEIDLGGDASPETRDFVGYDNLGLFLSEIASHFEEIGEAPDQVVLAGASAGGFGTLANYRQVAEALPQPAPVTLVDDSGPIVSDRDVLSEALEARWRSLWNLGEAFPAGEEVPLAPRLYQRAASEYPEGSFGIASYLQDGTIRDFYGYRHPPESSCPAPPEQCVSGPEYETALRDLSEEIASFSWQTFYVEGTDHTLIDSEAFYEVESGGQSAADWVRGLIENSGSSSSSSSSDGR